MKNAKVLIWALVVALVLGAVQPGFARVADVPTDHWAYQAVLTLVNKGYLAVYEDGTFQGTRPVDRYTLAVTLARILDEIEAGRVSGSAEDLGILRELTTELRAELVQWYTEREAIDEKLAETQKVGRATDERLSRVVAAQVELQEEVQKLKEEILREVQATSNALAEQQLALYQQGLAIQEMEQAIAQHGADISAEQETSRRHQELITELQTSLGELEALIAQLDTRIQRNAESIDGLENWVGEKGAVFALLQAVDAGLQQSAEQLAQEIVRLQQELEELDAESQEELAALSEQLNALITSVARTDGEFVQEIERNRTQNEELAQRNRELERDLQNLAVRLQREIDGRSQMTDALAQEIAILQANIQALAGQVGLSEEELAGIRQQISDEISIQLNTSLIREQRLERQLRELQDEFQGFKTTMEEQNKSLKNTTTIALVVAALAVVVGFFVGNSGN